MFTVCKKQPSTNPELNSQFSITGRVKDETGTGLAGIKIFYNSDQFVFTDAGGNFTTPLIKDSATIIPRDSLYSFIPAGFLVTDAAAQPEFTAQLLPHENIFSEKVFDWFNSMQLSNGLLESAENGNLVSLYDNALAACVFMAHGDNEKAEKVLDFFNNRINTELKSGPGGFYQFRDRNGVPQGNRWLGDNAWLLIAVNNYAARVNTSRYQSLAQELNIWIRSLQDVDGSLWGGFDNTGARIGKVTEGMIDAFNAVTGYDSFHQQLLSYLENIRWNSTEKLFESWPGNTYLYALDNFSWGYCTFEGYDEAVLQKADMFITSRKATLDNLSISGYCFDIDKDAVWLEGTGEMVVAWQQAGNIAKANYYLMEMEKVLVNGSLFPETKGLPYSSNMGTGYGTGLLWQGADTKPCVSSGAWYLFGLYQFNPMLVGYKKDIPIADKFWL